MIEDLYDYKKVDIGHGMWEWMPVKKDIKTIKNRSVSDGRNDMIGWGEKLLEANTENLVEGDSVVLLDYQHQIQGDSPSRFYWVDRLTPCIGDMLRVRRVMDKGVRVVEFDDAVGFNFHWVKKVSILEDELFEI